MTTKHCQAQMLKATTKVVEGMAAVNRNCDRYGGPDKDCENMHTSRINFSVGRQDYGTSFAPSLEAKKTIRHVNNRHRDDVIMFFFFTILGKNVSGLRHAGKA